MQLSIKLLHEDAKIPEYGSCYAAGLDIYSCVDIEVPPSTRIPISTGISLSWEGHDAENYYLRIAPRSGLSVKNSIDIGAGVIDYDYRGEIKVVFINNGQTHYQISKGDKIAQMVLEKINRFSVIQIVDELSDTERGFGGFGSTGK